MKNTRKMTSTIFAMLLGLLVIAASNQAFAQDGIWETKAPMPTARHVAAGGVINDKLYVAGGNGTSSLAILEVYDPGTDTWDTAKASMNTARNSVSGGVIDGKLYVVGGMAGPGNQKQTTLEVYDPVTNAWTTKAPMPTARSNSGVAAIDGKLYVAGGCMGWCSPVTSVLEVYDPATDTWTTKAPMPTGRGTANIAVENGLFYVMGGCCGSVASQSELMAKTIEVYNPTTNIWTTKTQHSVGSGGLAGSINGKIYVATGSATEAYDPATDTWGNPPLSPMPNAPIYAAGGVITGKLYVAGGWNGTNSLATLNAFSDYSISGKVKDIANGQTIQGVTITVKDANNDVATTTTTDSSGNFVANVPSLGNYTVSAAKTGYEMTSFPEPVILDSTHTAVALSLIYMESSVLTLTITLTSGWNFISAPIQPLVAGIGTVLKDISPNIRIVWGYDGNTQLWQVYKPSGSQNTSATVDAGKGCWIYMDNQATLTITGLSSTTPVHLYENWNLIGYKGTNGTSATTALSSLGDKWKVIWGWDNGTWSAKHATLTTLPVPALTNLYQGKAYWIKLKEGQAADWQQ